MYSVVNLTLMSFILVTYSGCVSPGIKFDPNFYVGDAENGQIVPREPFEVVSCFDVVFEEYACMHKDKIKELKTILKKGTLRRRYRRDPR